MQFEGGFIDPLGIDREDDRFPQGLKNVDAKAAGFGTRRSVDAQQLFTERGFLARLRLEADDEVKGHGGASLDPS